MEDLKKKKHAKSPAGAPEQEPGEPGGEPIQHPTKQHPTKMETGDHPDVEELRNKLEQKEKETKENYDRFLRMAADFENYKKRTAKEKEDWLKFANEDLLKAVLPFVDNLERALNHSDKTRDIQGLVEGVKLTIQQLIQALSKFGVSPMESLGKPFDPAKHEAMMVIETNQHEPNQVMEEFQKGYFLNDRLLRPATVSVSKPPEKGVQ